MRATLVLAMAVFGAAFFMVASAAAQSACGPRDRVLDWLTATYREAPIAAGVTGAGDLVEVYASADGATWTILVTSPGGRSCLVGAGEDWRALVRPHQEPSA